jgi:hypothetical protein
MGEGNIFHYHFVVLPGVCERGFAFEAFTLTSILSLKGRGRRMKNYCMVSVLNFRIGWLQEWEMGLGFLTE